MQRRRLKSIAGIKRVEPGDVYGRLTVFEEVSRDKHYNRRFLCRCSCGSGKRKIIVESNLRLGLTCSCGCLIPGGVYGFKPKKSESDVALAVVFGHYKMSARQRGKAFNLSTDQVKELISASCHYCGDQPRRQLTRKCVCVDGKRMKVPYNNFVYNGIDRVDPDKGYVFENLVPCCWECNRMKSSTKVEDFIRRIRRIYDCTIDVRL